MKSYCCRKITKTLSNMTQLAGLLYNCAGIVRLWEGISLLAFIAPKANKADGEPVFE